MSRACTCWQPHPPGGAHSLPVLTLVFFCPYRSVAGAISYISGAEQIHLAILGLRLPVDEAESRAGPAPNTDQQLDLDAVLSVPNGFDVAEALGAATLGNTDTVPTGEPHKPLVVMAIADAPRVLEHANREGILANDGSVNDCDCVLPRPLTSRAIRVFLEVCSV